MTTATEFDEQIASSELSAGRSNVDLWVAGLSAAAALIHLVMIPVHAGGGLWEPLGFAMVGWAQAGVAVALLTTRDTTWSHRLAATVNVVAIGMWVWSRTTGFPVGAHPGVAEAVGPVDLLTAGFEGAAVVASIAFLAGLRPRVGAAGLVGALAAVGLATGAAISPDAASHGGSATESAAGAGGHHGGAAVDTMAADMSFIDGARCDQAFNPVAYWREAANSGVDVYSGGAMGAHADTTLTGAVLTPDPLGGRGSAQLDKIVALTSSSTGSELDAAKLVTALADATDEEYQAWIGWVRNTQSASHGHNAAAPDDAGGHGGHAGTQPWKAMVDESQCDRLAEELDLARETALTYPNPPDAEAAGWEMVTPYVPGIGAHYMNYDLVDEVFAVDQPEMLLYDGTGPDAAIIGLSYYLLHDGEAEPTQGFTGGNDHFHRHIGLCSKDGVVIGDSTTTEEDCAARGGQKGTRSNGWMSHAWVVPGCESPWGVFSAASPMLDLALTAGSGTEGSEGCTTSSVRDRYDLTPGTATDVGTGWSNAAGEVAAGEGG